MRGRLLAACAIALLLATGVLAGPVARADTRSGTRSGHDVAVAFSPDRGKLAAVPCGVQVLELRITNDSDDAFFTDVALSAQAPLRIARRAVSTYVPAGYTVTVPVEVRAQPGGDPGTYEVTADGGRDQALARVSVEELTGDDLARGATPTASSTHGGFPVCGIVDGDRDQSDWAELTGWNDGTKGDFPDWVRVDFAQPQQVGAAEIVTRNGSSTPARVKGLRDWDVQVRADGEWQTVATVEDNEQGTVRSQFPAVTTSAVRILIHASNDGSYSRIVELSVYPD